MRIAVVVPRFGPDVLGGAEKQALGFAEEAARRGWPIEVWTTCARSHYTWDNVYPAGVSEDAGVVVRRFPITAWDHSHRAELEVRLAANGGLPVADQWAWLESGPHSGPLYEHVARHSGEFDVLVASPYATPLTHFAAWMAPGRTVVWPCLHDEPYAYMEPARLLMESVWGVMFFTPEERQLATTRLGIRPVRQAVLGGGVTLALPTDCPERTPLTDLLYVGRLEGGKNIPLLYEFVSRYADEQGGATRLVVVGDGPLRPAGHPALVYRGPVREEEKAAAYASALALCQPSLNESFSLTIMESWLAGRPVLVHGDCAVTRGHVQRSAGGLWFRNYQEFSGAVEWLKRNPGLARRMGHNGRQYVRRNYTWPAVVDRFEHITEAWLGSDSRTPTRR